MNRTELGSKKLEELRLIAKELGIKSCTKHKKDELIDVIIQHYISEDEEREKETEKETENETETETDDRKIGISQSYIRNLPDKITEEIQQSEEINIADGILELHTDGYGFMRSENYLSGSEDIYVSPSQIRRFNLRTGDKIYGITRPPKTGEKYKALLYVKKVNVIYNILVTLH